MKQIALSQGKFALVDDEWFDVLNEHKWYAHKDCNTFYAWRNAPDGFYRQKTVIMHNVIMQEKLKPSPKGTTVDHIDFDGLNNLTSNLRLASPSGQAEHTRARVTNHSGFKGVSWHKRIKKWQAQINYNRKVVFLGYYYDPKDAARAYDAKARELYGEFAYTNF